MRNITKKYEKPFIILFLTLVLIPISVFGQEQPFIPNCSPNCGYYDLFEMVNRIIKWIIMISIPVATGVLAWAGFLLMTTAVADKKSEAKKMIQKVFIGLALILSAWVIVSAVTNALLRDPDSVPVDLKIK